jgi:hypothetical protein
MILRLTSTEFLLIFAVLTCIQNTYSFVVNKKELSRSVTSLSTNLFRNFNDGGDSSGDFSPNSRNPRRAEFEISDDKPTPGSSLRKMRMEQERKNKDTFTAYGNDLWDLRSQLDDLSKQLMEVAASGGDTKSIREEMHRLEQKDANAVYALELDRMDRAADEGRLADAQDHRDKAMNARSHCVQFNFEGLWIGKYGDQGFRKYLINKRCSMCNYNCSKKLLIEILFFAEMVNVTYIGDTLIARKVTGDRTVPSGEISFQVDLRPPRQMNSLEENHQRNLPNLQISEKASKKWGNRELQRFKGLGQVSSEGFESSQWLEGQIVIVDENYFSFSWLPIGVQIFFGRPSPDMQLKMMQEAMEKQADENPVDASVEHLMRCFEDSTQGDFSESCIIIDDDICCFE